MMAPLTSITPRAVLWYQGESNAEGFNSTDYYACMFNSMITDWRARFNVGDFPFVFMQLPPSVPAATDPKEQTGRPEVRAAQVRWRVFVARAGTSPCASPPAPGALTRRRLFFPLGRLWPSPSLALTLPTLAWAWASTWAESPRGGACLAKPGRGGRHDGAPRAPCSSPSRWPLLFLLLALTTRQTRTKCRAAWPCKCCTRPLPNRSNGTAHCGTGQGHAYGRAPFLPY